jgi:protein TonB
VILKVLVGVDGRVLESQLVQSSGYPRLDKAALDGIKSNYRFTPGTTDGKPQQMWYTLKFNWKLQS